ncbi:uncharacterized protein TM35_001441020, partial [Trypanosoma theileri]
QGICAKVRCDNDKKVSVQLKGHVGNKEERWHKCPEDGGSINIADVAGTEFSEGTIVCPKYEEVCTGWPETNSPVIKLNSDKEESDGYYIVLNDGEKEAKPEKGQKPTHAPSVSSVSPEEDESHVELHESDIVKEAPESEHPDKHEAPKGQEPVKHRDASHNSLGNVRVHNTGVSTASSDGGIGTGGTNTNNNSAVGSGGISNEKHPVTVPERVHTTPPPPTPAAPLPTPADPLVPAKTPADGALQQPVDPPAENNDKQNEIQTSPELKSPTGEQEKNSSPAGPNDKVHSSNSSTTASEDSIKVQSDAREKESEQKKPRDNADDVATAPSTSNPNSNGNTMQSTNTINGANEPSTHTANNTVLNGTNLNEDQMKETLNHTNVMNVMGPDSSIMVSYMAPLALLVCVVGFVMVP